MNGPRRVGFRLALVTGVVAAVLAACGVKGDLQPPVASATSPAPAEQKAQGSQAQQKTFTEQSVVRRASSPTVIPTMPPEEWSKGRNTQPAVQQKSRDKDKPDEPFFLDKLL